jgi:hypothetical protein
MTSNDPRPTLAACLISAADIPEQPLCCQHAQERGYRRGYRDGYWYALWDLAKLVRISDTLWAQLEAFMYGTVKHWVWRASHQPGLNIEKLLYAATCVCMQS